MIDIPETVGLVLGLLVCVVLSFEERTGYFRKKFTKSRANDSGGLSKNLSKFKHKSLDERFEEAYLWACDVFGVSDNVYDTLENNMKTYRSLGRPYFTYHNVSEYEHYYPRKIPRCENRIKEWEDNSQIKAFANEFIGVVNSIKQQIDQEDLKLLKEYGVNTKYLLTNEFKVDKLKLFNIEQ